MKQYKLYIFESLNSESILLVNNDGSGVMIYSNISSHTKYVCLVYSSIWDRFNKSFYSQVKKDVTIKLSSLNIRRNKMTTELMLSYKDKYCIITKKRIRVSNGFFTIQNDSAQTNWVKLNEIKFDKVL